jgi:hypothetical protein
MYTPQYTHSDFAVHKNADTMDRSVHYYAMSKTLV